MAQSHWLTARAQTLQHTCFDPQTGQIADPKMFSLYQRYETTHTRSFHKALNDLLKLRAEKRKAEIGFEAQNHKAEQLRIQNEKHEMKKHKHYWEVLAKDAQVCNQLATNTTQQINAGKENPAFAEKFEAELANRGLDLHGSRVATAA